MTSKKPLAWLVTLFGVIAAPDPLSAQGNIAANQSGNEGTKTPEVARDEKAIMLSSFQVNTDRDVGYLARDSLSGSRLNTSLRDTAAQISVFTPEFIADLGANNLAEIMPYSANYQFDVDDANPGMTGAVFTGVNGQPSNTLFRIRNMPGSRAFDFFATTIPGDNYNVGRFETVSGPNAILFGFGSPGGVVNTTTKTALTSRNSGSLRLQSGSWSRLRGEIDLNQVILKDKLALRLMALAESLETWRKFGFSEQERGTIAATYQPFKRTAIRAMYEKGRTERNSEIPIINAIDGYALWDARGRITKDGFAAAVDRPNGINQLTGVKHVFIQNNNSYVNDQNRLVSTFESLSLPAAQRAGVTLVPEEFLPYDIAVSGPGARIWQDFHQARVFLEHRFTDALTAEIAYNRMWNYDWNFTPGNQINVTGDPNLSITPANGITAPNPMAGRLYMEYKWQHDTLFYDTNNWRATVAYELNLGKVFGHHKFAGLLQNERTLLQRRIYDEILTDGNNVPISNATLPENAVNFLTRRNYLTEGDHDTYYAGDIRMPFRQTIRGTEYQSRWMTRNQTGQNRTRKDIDTWMFVAQSFLWKDRLAATFGYRSDHLALKQYIAQRSAAADPLVLSGERLVNEWEFSSTPTPADYKPRTRTLGGVFHVTRNISVFYNESSNVGEPSLNSTLVPDSSIPRPIRGVGSDYGLMLELFSGRAHLRINQYETFSYDTPDGNATNIISTPVQRVMDTLLTRNIISTAEYGDHLITGTNGLSDRSSRGTEVTLTANPTRQWALQANYSYNNQSKTNFMKEAEEAILQIEDWWRGRIQASGLSPSAISTAAFAGSQGSVEDDIAWIKRTIVNQRVDQELGFGKRPHKANVFTRYTFAGGALRGIMVGGGARYLSKSFNGRDTAIGRDFWGEPIFQVDLLLGYRKRLARFIGGKPVNFSIQLNVNNALNDSDALVGRLNTLNNGINRVYLQEPRSFRITTEFSF